MNETNIDAAGYELLKIATRVANSEGVLSVSSYDKGVSRVLTTSYIGW